MKLLILPGVLLALILSGCRTAPNPATPPVLSRGITVEERSADFYETLPRPIRPDAYRPRVDYQSELRIVVNTNELFKEISAPANVLPLLTPEQQARLDRLSDLLRGARRYLEDFNNFVRKYDELKDVPPTPQNQKLLLDLIRTQGQSETNYLRPLVEYVDAKIRAENPTFTRSQIIRARDQVRGPSNTPLFSPGKDLDFAALSEFIASESASVIRQASQDARAVREAGTVSLRIRASLLQQGQNEVPLHILNYDVLSDANVTQEPRISLQMSDDDRRRLAAETQVNTEIARLGRDLQNSTSDLRRSLDSLLTALRGDLASWKEAATNFESLELKLEPLLAALDKAQVSLQLSAAQKKIVADAKDLFAAVTNQVRQVRNAINLFVRPIDPDAAPAATLMASVDTLSRSLGGLVNFPSDMASRASATLDGLKSLASDIQTAIPQDTPHLQDFANVFMAGAPTSAEAITNLLGVTLQNYPHLVAELKSLTGKSQILAAASNLPPIQTDPNLLDIAVAAPPDGLISLRKNVVRGDATVTLDAALVTRKDANAPPEVKPVAHQEFAVEKFGIVNTWSANLILVSRLGNLDPTERTVRFSPAPSISWTLHYNPPPNPAVEFRPRKKFWSTVDPGVGVNVAALNWDSGVQLGLGGHVSFFHDMLSVGGGYNLNESRHGGYVFIGLGLFQALNKLGITGANFPLGR